MLKSFQIESLFETLGIGEAGRRLIEEIRISEPVRRVGGGTSNVCVRYPSRKMGRIIQAESHTVELPFIYELEHDPEVFEYYDQPTSLKINVKGNGNRNFGFFYTPDFLVIGSDCIRFVECKSGDDLKKLAEKNLTGTERTRKGYGSVLPAKRRSSSMGSNFVCGHLMRRTGSFMTTSDFSRTTSTKNARIPPPRRRAGSFPSFEAKRRFPFQV